MTRSAGGEARVTRSAGGEARATRSAGLRVDLNRETAATRIARPGNAMRPGRVEGTRREGCRLEGERARPEMPGPTRQTTSARALPRLFRVTSHGHGPGTRVQVMAHEAREPRRSKTHHGPGDHRNDSEDDSEGGRRRRRSRDAFPSRSSAEARRGTRAGWGRLGWPIVPANTPRARAARKPRARRTQTAHGSACRRREDQKRNGSDGRKLEGLERTETRRNRYDRTREGLGMTHNGKDSE